MKSIVLIATCLAVAGLAAADSLTIDLPGLTGGYEYSLYTEPNLGYPQMRAVDFTIPGDVTAIDQFTLVLSGEWTAGKVTCFEYEDPVPSEFLPPLSLFLTSPAFPDDYFVASVAMPAGEFSEIEATFYSCCPQGVLDPNQLLGTEVHAEMFFDIAILGICWLSIDTYGTLNDARLEITGTVAAETSTWSAVKGLYR
jgi:hypothetical protein